MSAFMVADNTINRIVTFLKDDRDSGQWTADRLATELGLKWNNGLGQAMFNLNIKGVDTRYGKGEAKGFRPLTFRPAFVLGNRFQALKALQCWLYQCSEGDVVDTPLYKIMHQYSHSMLNDIVRRLPQYEAAEWG